MVPFEEALGSSRSRAGLAGTMSEARQTRLWAGAAASASLVVAYVVRQRLRKARLEADRLDKASVVPWNFGLPSSVDAASEEPYRVLCFGDSNTWGFVPFDEAKGLERHGCRDRYPRVTREALRDGGANWEVVEAGLNSRTTAVDDPQQGDYDLNGRKALPVTLHAAKPLHAVVIMFVSPGALAGARLAYHLSRVGSARTTSSRICRDRFKTSRTTPCSLAAASLNPKERAGGPRARPRPIVLVRRRGSRGTCAPRPTWDRSLITANRRRATAQTTRPRSSSSLRPASSRRPSPSPGQGGTRVSISHQSLERGSSW